MEVLGLVVTVDVGVGGGRGGVAVVDERQHLR